MLRAPVGNYLPREIIIGLSEWSLLLVFGDVFDDDAYGWGSTSIVYEILDEMVDAVFGPSTQPLSQSGPLQYPSSLLTTATPGTMS